MTRCHRSPLDIYFMDAVEAKGTLADWKKLEPGRVISVNMASATDSEEIIPLSVSRGWSIPFDQELWVPRDSTQKWRVVEKKKETIWKIFHYDPWDPSEDTTLSCLCHLQRICDNYLSDDVHETIKSFLCARYEYIVVEPVNKEEGIPTFVIRSNGNVIDMFDFRIRGHIDSLYLHEFSSPPSSPSKDPADHS